jgi:hypothetical protein
MVSNWKEGPATVRLRHGRLSDRPGLTAPAFQSCLPQEVMFMHLWVKVVSLFGTIVLKLRWKRR